MHITVKNVRRVHAPPLFDERDVRKCAQVFSTVVSRHRPFSFQLEEVVPFASSVAVIGYCDERLRELVLDLDGELRNGGVPDDKEYVSDSVFFGNVTICRFTSPPQDELLRRVAELRHALGARVAVEAVSLITCDSVCSRGSLAVIRRYPLADQTPPCRQQPEAADV